MSISMEEEHKNVKAMLDWFIDTMGAREWQRRRTPIQRHMETVFEPGSGDSTRLQSDESRVSFEKDRLAWYLYLADKHVHDIMNYEFNQGARIIPVFFKLGQSIEALKTIKGVEQRVSEILNQRRNDPDAGLFELLAGLAYVNDGWEEVTFISEKPPARTPDLRVAGHKGEWLIECKRMSKTSEYSAAERQNWLRLWPPIAHYLSKEQLPVLLDISFHVELSTLPDDYLARFLIPKLRLMGAYGTLADNDTCTIIVKPMDMDRIQNHLESQDVKIGSALFRHLLSGCNDTGRGFTHVMLARPRPDNHTYVAEIEFAAGALWSCDSEVSIKKKARGIIKQIIRATGQFPDHAPAVIHVGLESQDGPIIEQRQYKHIMESLLAFNFKHKDVMFVFCHVFDPRSTPDEPWDFGETVHWFRPKISPSNPLRNIQFIVPNGTDISPEKYF